MSREDWLNLCWNCWNAGTKGLNKKDFKLFLEQELDDFCTKDVTEKSE